MFGILHDSQDSRRYVTAMLEAKRSNNAEEMKSALEEACTMICVGGENFVRNL